MPTNAEKVLTRGREQGIVRTRDVVAMGIPRVTLTRLEQAGRLDRIGRGLYSVPDTEVSEHHALAAASRRVPKGIVCLLSALRFHGMTAQQPFEVWMAIDRKARCPAVDHPPLRIVRFSGVALTDGIRTHKTDGVPARVTDPVRTVADGFRHRNKIGIDVAIEALREYRRLRKGSLDALAKAAQARRAAKVMRPYPEALA
jgi:predicted transcriptional regulator of viral defense system